MTTTTKPAQPLPPLEWAPPATNAPGLAMAELHTAVASLGAAMLRNAGFPAGMQCKEADTLAQALIAVGYAQAAVHFIADHSGEDDTDHDHYVQAHNDAFDTDAARWQAAEDHVRALAARMGLPELAATIVTRASRVLLTDAALVKLVRAGIPGQLPHVAGVLFAKNQEHQYGTLSATGQLFYTDGGSTSVCWFEDLDDSQLFDARFGDVGWHAALAVIPNTGEVLFAADNQDGQLQEWIASRPQPPL